MITSIQNSKIKRTRDLLSAKKHRDASGQMVIEGVRLAEEALNCGIKIHLCLFSTSLSDRGRAVVDQLARNSVEVEEVSTDLMKRISDTQTPQGILLITDIPTLALPDEPDALLVLDIVRNPGNMGTILRTAAALGMDGVILTPGTADPFAPKALRSAMGAQFHLPVIWKDVQEIHKFCTEENNLHIFSAVSEGTLPCWKANLSQPICLIIGGEAEGVSSTLKEITHQQIRIPIGDKSESLNAAVAASILMYELKRQRNNQ